MDLANLIPRTRIRTDPLQALSCAVWVTQTFQSAVRARVADRSDIHLAPIAVGWRDSPKHPDLVPEPPEPGSTAPFEWAEYLSKTEAWPLLRRTHPDGRDARRAGRHGGGDGLRCCGKHLADYTRSPISAPPLDHSHNNPEVMLSAATRPQRSRTCWLVPVGKPSWHPTFSPAAARS